MHTPSSTSRENDLQRLTAIYLQIISRRPLLDTFGLTRTHVNGWNHITRHHDVGQSITVTDCTVIVSLRIYSITTSTAMYRLPT